MKRALFVLLMLVASGTAQEAKPSRAACRTNLRLWTTAIRSADATPACSDSMVACPFSGELKDWTSDQLVIVSHAAIACTHVDKHRAYEWVALRMVHFAMQRVGGFWLSSEPTFQQFLDWEQEQQGIAPLKDDDPDMVARR
jgi:hypothetical protein